MVRPMPDSLPLALCAAQPIPDGGPPAAIHLLPAGVIRTVDGRGPYRVPDPAALAGSLSGERLPIDENHATDLAAPHGGPSPARGWIVGLEARQDGIWGRVEWTEAGKALVADRAYRGISPVIVHDAAGNVTGILRASLINTPNLRGLTALHSSELQTMDLADLRKALGLPDTADGPACLAAIGKLTGAAAGAQSALLAPIAKAAGLAATADGAAVLQAVTALADPAKMVPAAQVAALQTQFTALQTQVLRDKAEAFVDGAVKAGRVGLKPLRDHYIARHMADAAAVEKEIGAMPVLQGRTPASAAPPAAPLDKDGKPALPALDENEAKIMALLGVDPEKARAQKAALAQHEEAL